MHDCDIEKMLSEREALLIREYDAALDLACFGARDTILDIATGSGRMLLQILKRGYSVVSGDIDREALNRARERLGELASKPTLVVLNAHQMQFDDDSFHA
ncbi:MAG: class I SAM-dependent methyltransferase, partial [Armatimonadota bacterium]